jgi:dUTP pyrophosphatase
MQSEIYTMKQVTLGCYKLHPEAFLPAYATQHSACFDVRVCLPAGKREVDMWGSNSVNYKSLAFVDDVQGTKDASVLIRPGERALLPTQLILDIPEGYSVRLHMRSGLALKGGLMLSNCEGVIDSDYTHQLMVPVTNTSTVNVRITHGDRICQGEIVEKIYTNIVQIADEVKGKTDRSGGFGSTGKA